jgi:cyclopropane fatty-acyl-phospholipid synthase-like methyltransferase
MPEFSEAEKQILLSAWEEAQAREKPGTKLQSPAEYFRRYLVDWTRAYDVLVERGFLARTERGYALTTPGEAAAGQLRRAFPPEFYWYSDYYAAVQTSQANAAYCERVFGRNLCQHGFAEMAHLDRLLEVAGIRAGHQVLDLGCGNGLISEYLSDVTGAHATGVDFIPDAIRQAQDRTRDKQHRLTFRIGNLNRLDFPAHSFDVLISIDTLYFIELDETIPQMKAILRPDGQMAIFYSYGIEPGGTPETFPRDELPADNTPLAQSLRKHGLSFQTWDFTAQDYAHARRKKQVAEELRAGFEAEGNAFLYDSHHAEAEGVMHAVEAGLHARYLYQVTLQPC